MFGDDVQSFFELSEWDYRRTRIGRSGHGTPGGSTAEDGQKQGGLRVGDQDPHAWPETLHPYWRRQFSCQARADISYSFSIY